MSGMAKYVWGVLIAAVLSISVAAGGVLAAQTDEPLKFQVAEDGTLYIADTYNHVVRRVGRNDGAEVAGVAARRASGGEKNEKE